MTTRRLFLVILTVISLSATFWLNAEANKPPCACLAPLTLAAAYSAQTPTPTATSIPSVVLTAPAALPLRVP
ncbi:MAG: hypothetical protein H7Y11_04130 [Armatimonadetes bacterium]|nr:hypothetical protein [Anaerolineae bacterium]